MNREIKFRAWDTEEQRWQHWFWLTPDGDVDIDEQDPNHPATLHKVRYTERFVVQQYTGLKDKNGDEIYEGDIVSGAFGSDDPAEVKLEPKGAWWYWWREWGVTEDELEVVGNVYKNPELLK